MKKTLVALAALAVVGAASAQSTVTLYGRLDASVGKNELKNNAGYTLRTGFAGADPGLNVNGSNMSGNRWGMMGTEDLGGGMKAKFQLESGFNIDSGTSAQGGALFGRHSWVGLAGGFGEVRLGRQTTILADGPWAVTGGYANYDAWSRAGAGAFGNAGSVAADVVRTNNSLKYMTPTMGGFSGTFVWSPGENGVVAGASADKYWSLGAGFVSGPINVQFGYESFNAVNPGAAAPVAATTKQWALAGAYDLGVARLSASVERASRANVDDKGYALGVGVPLGPMTLDLEWASEKTDGGNKATALSVRGVYNLSKRTNLYLFLSDGTAKTAVAGDKSSLSRFQVGMRHVF